MSYLNHTSPARNAIKAFREREVPPRFRSAFVHGARNTSRNSFVSAKSKQHRKFAFKPGQTRFARTYFSDESRIINDINQNCHENFSDATGIVGKEQDIQSVSCWNVDKIDQISPFYHVEKSHEYIENKTPEEVASFISDCLKKDFAIISYDDTQAIAYVETKADKSKSDYCKLQIRLYIGSSSSDSSSVLVEVQRRSGCSIKFNSMARKVLCAAKGVEYKEVSPSYGGLPSCLAIDPSILGEFSVSRNNREAAYAH